MQPRFFMYILFLFTLGCSKPRPVAQKSICWEMWDQNGASTKMVFCDKTITELKTQFPGFHFFDTAEVRQCWQIEAGAVKSFVRNHPKSAMVVFFPGMNYQPVDCASFCIWKIQLKRQSKRTGSFVPIQQRIETFAVDSCRTIFKGRTINTQSADTIYITEFVQEVR